MIPIHAGYMYSSDRQSEERRGRTSLKECAYSLVYGQSLNYSHLVTHFSNISYNNVNHLLCA